MRVVAVNGRRALRFSLQNVLAKSLKGVRLVQRIPRRSLFGLMVALLSVEREAESAPLPLALQAELLSRLAGYDKGFRARAGSIARILLVTKGSPEDAQWATRLEASLEAIEQVGGLPHSESIVPFANGADLARRIKAERIAIVVLPASLGSDVADVRAAFDGLDVLSVVPDSSLVKAGIVLGYELVSGKPKLFFNPAQATRQKVVMSADAMKVMTVFE